MEKYSIRTALIITSYNWPNAINLVLESVTKQTVAPDYVLVADDGSGFAVRDAVSALMGRLRSLRYVWQADTAFRAARVRNLAALKTDADHFVFIDGDCLLPPTFIERHRELIRPNTLVAGGRYLATEEETESLLRRQVVVKDSLFSGFKFKSLSLGPLRDLGPRNWGAVRTCNFGLMRSDFSFVGGFDESFIGWGKEDTDLVVRLLNAGLTIRSGRFGACVYHLNHPKAERACLPENDKRLRRVIDNSAIIQSMKTAVTD